MLNQAIIWALRAIMPLAVLAAGYHGYSYLIATKPDVPARKAREKVWPVHTVPVQFSDYQPNLQLFGTTTAGRHVELRALVAGEVVETGAALKEGAEVNEGDLILQIDPFDYRGALTEAHANLSEARAKLDENNALLKLETESLNRASEQLELADKDLTRALPLAKKGTVSEQAADQRRLTVSQRNQSVEQIKNNITIQKARAAQQRAAIKRLKWKVTKAERSLKDTELRAPFNAYVLSVRAEKGRLLGVSDSVVTLLDKNWIDVKFTLSDSQYGRILSAEGSVIGRKVQVKWYVGEKPFTYQATVERVNAEISSEEGGVTLFARLEDPTMPIPIRPGAFVEIDIPDRRYQRVARLPRTALYGRDKVFIVNQDRLEARSVELVGNAKNEILIRGNLKANDQVIVTRLSEAGDGVKVRVTAAKNKETPTPKKTPQTPKSAGAQKTKPEAKASEQHENDRASKNIWSPVGSASAAEQERAN